MMGCRGGVFWRASGSREGEGSFRIFQDVQAFILFLLSSCRVAVFREKFFLVGVRSIGSIGFLPCFRQGFGHNYHAQFNKF